MLLQLESISKSYDLNKGRLVLNQLSLEVDKGETVAIVGPSGSGKSTLLNIIGALDKPDEGQVLFEGNNIAKKPEKALAHFRSHNVGFVFQSHHLLPQCNVLENVLIPTLTIKDNELRKQCAIRAEELIRHVGMWGNRQQCPGTLSGGERQRVAVIRALVNNPQLVLADEPTGSLDRSNALIIKDLLLQLNREFNTALIVVTHSDTIADQMSRTYRLIDGKLGNE